MTYRSDYYEILQVSPNDSLEVIHAAYRRLSHRHHPDVGGDEVTMKLLNEAYNALCKNASRDQCQNWPESSNTPVVQMIRPWLSFLTRWTEITMYSLMFGWVLGFTDTKTDEL